MTTRRRRLRRLTSCARSYVEVPRKAIPLAPPTAYRRSELQALYEKFEAEIEKLNQRVEEQACKRLGARLLMTHTKISQSSWSDLSNKDYYVTINVVSARKSSEDNLLDCADPIDRISRFAGKSTQVFCRLIDEHDRLSQ